DRHVALEQRRRNGEDVADVIETVSGIVYWQKAAGMNVKCEDIAHGVAIFRAIETVYGGAAGVGMGGGNAVEGLFDGLGDGSDGCRRRMGHTGWRHLAATQFAEDLFEQGAVTRGVVQIDADEIDARCIRL